MSTIDEAVQAFREVAIRGCELWGDELSEVAKFGCEAVEPMLVLLKDKDPQVREATADVIDLWSSDERVVDPLVAALGDSDRGVRLNAVVRLGSTGHLRAVEPLIGLLDDNDSELRKQALRSLGRIGGERAMEATVRALREDPDTGVRASATYALADVGMYEPLIAAWKDGLPLPAVTTPQLLREIGGDESQSRIIDLLEHAEQRDVRAKAARVLGEIGGPDVVQALRRALNDPEWHVQIAAASALSSLGDDSGVDTLIRLAQGRDHIAHFAAIYDIGKLKIVEALDALIGMLSDEDRRLYAASALGDLGDPKALEPLTNALEAGVASAARALGNYDDPRAVDALIGALEYDDYAMRMNALHALVQIGDSRAVGPIAHLLSTGPQSIRWDAAKALGKIADPSATDALAGAVESDDAHLRRNASEALTRMHTPQAEEVLLGLLPKNDIDAISGAYTFFIEKDVPGSESALVDALTSYGNKSMAKDYAVSGNDTLAEAGREWLANHPSAKS